MAALAVCLLVAVAAIWAPTRALADTTVINGELDVVAAAGQSTSMDEEMNPVPATPGQAGEVVTAGEGGYGDVNTQWNADGADGGTGLEVYGGNGGDTGAMYCSAGDGGDGLHVIAGNGGDVVSSSPSNYPGHGGAIYLAGGSGGSALYDSGAYPVVGGTGGDVNIVAGDGGSSVFSTAGNGASIYLKAGLGGNHGNTGQGYDGGVIMEAAGCVLKGIDGGLQIPGYHVQTWNSVDFMAGALSTYRARGTSSASTGIQADDVSMHLQGWGYGCSGNPNSGVYQRLATIAFMCDGTANETYMPGRIYFAVTPANSAQNVRAMTIYNDGQLCLGDQNHVGSYSSYHVYDRSGAYLTGGGYWYQPSNRALKKNITTVAGSEAWDLLDKMQVVDYEYKKQETRVKMKDGRVLTLEDASAELQGQKGRDGRQISLEEAGAQTCTVRTDEGSGEWHRGFIVEDMPDKLVPTEKNGIAALDVAANNTGALQEAKRRILALEDRVAKLELTIGQQEQILTNAGLTADGVLVLTPTAKTPDAVPDRAVVWAQRVDGVTELRAQNSSGDVSALTLHDSVGAGWVEITLAEAMVEVPETKAVESTQAVTRYRINWETKTAEPYETEETVVKQVPTGRLIAQLADGVRFDAATGKCWRWAGK